MLMVFSFPTFPAKDVLFSPGFPQGVASSWQARGLFWGKLRFGHAGP
jgi:hypothetical protein